MNTANYILQYGQDETIAIITEKSQYTYKDLRSAVNKIATKILSIGILPGDAVGLLSANSLFWVASYLAIMKIGGIAVPFSTTLTTKQFQQAESFIKCKAICLQELYRSRYVSALKNKLPIVSENILLPTDSMTVEESPETVITDPEQDAAFMLTSGTTSEPKVVRVSHENIQSNTESIISYLEITNSDRIMVILPFFYCFGTSLLHTHLRAGGSLVISNRFAFPETVLNLMETYNCTGFAGVPSTYQILLRNTTFPKRKLPMLKKIQQAGGKLPSVLIKELRAILPDSNIYIMYGQTEATARLSYLHPEMLERKLGSIGKGIPGVELRVVGSQGIDVSHGEVGEIVAKGKNITKGYLNDLQATAVKFRDGNLYTGDLATVDEDGFIYIVDRSSDFIKSYGHRVSSQQIEGCISELQDVISTAVIGVQDVVRGEAIVAYVTLHKKSILSSENIIAHCRQTLPSYMIPRDVIVVSDLPMNEQGKILKSALKQQVLGEL